MRLRSWALAGTALITATCVGALAIAQSAPVPEGTAPSPAASAPAAPVPVLTEADRSALMRAVGGPQRINPERDRARNPLQTLQFFGIRASDTVLEIWPGQGWYSTVLAPYLRAGGGQLIAGHFDADASGSAAVRRVVYDYTSRFGRNPELYGTVSVVPFGPRSGPLGPPNSVDAVVTFRNVHNFVAQGWSEKAFADMFAVLKPGGILGIEDHRASPDEPQDPLASDGYVREDFVIQMAEEAGFEFIGRSEINANPRDTRDHPFGVWTLPPVLRTSPLGQPDNPAFDTSRYQAIGESDRMTLRFRKPLSPGASASHLAASAPAARAAPAGRPVDLSAAPATASRSGAPVPVAPPPRTSPPSAVAGGAPDPAATSSASTPQTRAVARPVAPLASPPPAPPPPAAPSEPSPPAPPPPAPEPVRMVFAPPPPPQTAPTGQQPVASGPMIPQLPDEPDEPPTSPASAPAATSPPPPPPPPPPAAAARRSPPPTPAAAQRRPPSPPPAANPVRRASSPPPPAAARRASPPPPAAARRSPPPPPPARRPASPPPPPPPRDPNKPHWGTPKS